MLRATLSGSTAALALLTHSVSALRVSPDAGRAVLSPAAVTGRRKFVGSLCASCLVAGGVLPLPAGAFENAVPEYAEYAGKPKRPGNAPKDLGLAKRTINENSIDADPKTFEGLRVCDGKPHCFSTTGDDLLEDRIQYGVDNLITPWKPPASDPAPFKTLVAAVKAYPPGQGFVDGGGFQVVKETDSYIYLQFEALKKGYIDDVEFAFRNGVVQVRSSSRVGTTDFGVNAKRLNFISSGLRSQGWDIPELTSKTHRDYFDAAVDAADQTFDQDRRRGTGLEEKRLERGLGASAPSV